MLLTTETKYRVFSLWNIFCVLSLFKIPGFLSLLRFPEIRNNQVWILCHPWHPFQNRSSNLLDNNHLRSRSKSHVLTAKNLCRRVKLHISGKAPFIFFVPQLAFHHSHINQLQRNSVLCAKSKDYVLHFYYSGARTH